MWSIQISRTRTSPERTGHDQWRGRTKGKRGRTKEWRGRKNETRGWRKEKTSGGKTETIKAKIWRIFTSMNISFHPSVIDALWEWIISRINSSSHLIRVNFALTDAYLVTIERDILRNIELSGQRANAIVIVKSDALMAALTRREEDCRQGNQDNQFIFVIAWLIDRLIGVDRRKMWTTLDSLVKRCCCFSRVSRGIVISISFVLQPIIKASFPKSLRCTTNKMLNRPNNPLNIWMQILVRQNWSRFFSLPLHVASTKVSRSDPFLTLIAGMSNISLAQKKQSATTSHQQRQQSMQKAKKSPRKTAQGPGGNRVLARCLVESSKSERVRRKATLLTAQTPVTTTATTHEEF